MYFIIKHHSSYTYSGPVFLEPQYLYFYPAGRSNISVVDFDLQISPSPEGCSPRLDPENNVYHQCWFSGKTEILEVAASSRIKITSTDPFNFLVDPNREAMQLEALQLYLKPRHELSEEIDRWLNRFYFNSADNISGFLLELCQAISAGWDHTIRYGEHLMDPNQCFADKSGSCRDLAWMMIQVLRNLGMSCRFVSGYSYNPELKGHELHAWVEVWVAGAGWIGLDPSAGLFITREYVPVSASYHPANTLPVQGNYRGEAASNLKTAVNIVIEP